MRCSITMRRNSWLFLGGSWATFYALGPSIQAALSFLPSFPIPLQNHRARSCWRFCCWWRVRNVGLARHNNVQATLYVSAQCEIHTTFRSKTENFLNFMYRDEIDSLQILLSRTQAGPGRAVKELQEQNSPNHVQIINLISV